MTKAMRFFYAVALSVSLSTSAFAQSGNVDELVAESKNDLLVVVSGGLAGAVLGLSTLSFVEEPKDHTRNILVGASIGIIAGVGYVAFSQANKSRDLLYGPVESGLRSTKEFDTLARADWHASSLPSEPGPIDLAPFSFRYSFRY